MPGFFPGIHVFLFSLNAEDVDGRDKPGHDGVPYPKSARTFANTLRNISGVSTRVLVL
jgi:hypothetical protein